MAKKNTIYVCESCGEEFTKWAGRCAACGQWNSLREMSVSNLAAPKQSIKASEIEIQTLDQIKSYTTERLPTGLGEFDRVLGGDQPKGIVAGSVILLGGDPGIGKSTLALELARQIENILYVSGEESLQQIKIRAERLGLGQHKIQVMSETNIDYILAAAKKVKPALLVIDSIQTAYDPTYPSTPGSLVQVRESSLKFQKFAKQNDLAIILIGHVTKEGNVAGPKTLEHLVDTVLYLEGDKFGGTRILRSIKNRFGKTNEVGIFEMKNKGLVEITNPSKIFLQQRLSSAIGSAITTTIEGSRPLLLEIQALTSRASFGYPQRKTSGFDLNRLQLLAAVITSRTKIKLGNRDLFLNVAGGLKIKEPAADLGACLAIASSYYEMPLPPKLVAIGEVGLSGEVRMVTMLSERINEAIKLGFSEIIVPHFGKKIISTRAKIKPVRTLQEMFSLLKLQSSLKK